MQTQKTVPSPGPHPGGMSWAWVTRENSRDKVGLEPRKAGRSSCLLWGRARGLHQACLREGGWSRMLAVGKEGDPGAICKYVIGHMPDRIPFGGRKGEVGT